MKLLKALLLVSVLVVFGCANDNSDENTPGSGSGGDNKPAPSSSLFSVAQKGTLENPNSRYGLWQSQTVTDYDAGKAIAFTFRMQFTRNRLILALRCQVSEGPTIYVQDSVGYSIKNDRLVTFSQLKKTGAKGDWECSIDFPRIKVTDAIVLSPKHGRMTGFWDFDLTKVAD